MTAGTGCWRLRRRADLHHCRFRIITKIKVISFGFIQNLDLTDARGIDPAVNANLFHLDFSTRADADRSAPAGFAVSKIILPGINVEAILKLPL